MFLKYMLMNEAPAEGGAGGSGASLLGSAAPAAGQAPPAEGQQAPQQQQAAAYQWPSDWKNHLGEFKDDPSLGPIQDIPNLVKSFVNAQKLIGKQGVHLPDQHATPEDWKKFHQKHFGLPESLDKYEIKAPEGYEKGFVDKLREFAFERNLPPKATEELLGWYKGISDEMVQAEEQALAAHSQEQINGLKKEWGQAFEKNLKIANAALEKFADAETIQHLHNTGLANDVRLTKMLAKIGAALGEDKFVGDSDKTKMTPAEALSRRDAIMSNPSHPYWQPGHPGNAAAKDEVRGYNTYLASVEDAEKI